MRLMRFPYTIAGQWVSGLTIVALIVATTGCNGFEWLGATSAGDNPFGVLVNTDTSKDLIGGVRLESGEAVYVYGTFNEDGTVKEITAAVIQNTEGEQASLTFESGRPKKGVAFDGSTLEMTYDEVSNERLSGQVVLVAAESGVTQTIPFDIDLLKAAADLAQMVEDLTGIAITADAPPSDSAARQLKSVESVDGSSKSLQRTEVSIVVIALVPIAFATAGFLLTSVMAQMMDAFVEAAETIARATVIAVFAPFIIMGNLMRLAVSQPILTIDVEIQGTALGIPARPRL